MPDIALRGTIEIQKSIVYREQDDRDDTEYQGGPFRICPIADVDDLFTLPLTGRVIPLVIDVRRQCRANESTPGSWIVLKADLPRN